MQSVSTALQAHPIWRCPRCRRSLQPAGAGLDCHCGASYPVIGGIPDLRVPGPSWIDYEEDRQAARKLLAETEGMNAAQVISHIFASRESWTQERIQLRTRQVLEAPDRLRSQLREWLQPCMPPPNGLFLDLGCGPGMLLTAAASEGYRGIGIDVSLVWLIAAQRLLLDRGAEPVLAAALAEALPLENGFVSSVISLDVIEHVADPAPYLAEIDRVTAPGGHIAFSTPNRYSLAAEPHVFLWGVGWLPRSWQKQYVWWRRKEKYDYARLLSTLETRRLLRQKTSFVSRFLIPPIPQEEIESFPSRRAGLARLYNNLVARSWVRWIFLGIGPFFRVLGRKPA